MQETFVARYKALATGVAIVGSIPAGTFVSWEDLPFPASDFNYNDLNFVFTNVSVSVPGPIAGAGLPGIVLAGGWHSRLVATAAEDRLKHQG